MTRFILVCSLMIFVSFVQTLPYSTSVEDEGEEIDRNLTQAVNGSGLDL